MSGDAGSCKGDEWTPEKTQKLIKELEIRPCLWRKQDKNYKNKHLRATALDDIADIIGKSSESVKDKIRSLRTIFMQVQKRKDKYGRTRGSHPPKWEYFQALTFLASEVAPADKVDSIERGRDEDDITLSKVGGGQRIHQEFSTDTFYSTEAIDEHSNESIGEPSRKIRRNMDPLSEQRLSLWQSLNQTITTEKLGNQQFVESISGSLNLITGKQLLIKTKSRMLLVLSDALAEQARSDLNGTDVRLYNTSKDGLI